MRRYLLSTVCYPVMNLSINIDLMRKREAEPEYQHYTKRMQANRYKAIFA